MLSEHLTSPTEVSQKSLTLLNFNKTQVILGGNSDKPIVIWECPVLAFVIRPSHLNTLVFIVDASPGEIQRLRAWRIWSAILCLNLGTNALFGLKKRLVTPTLLSWANVVFVTPNWTSDQPPPLSALSRFGRLITLNHLSGMSETDEENFTLEGQ